MAVVAVWSPVDLVLSLVAPLGCALQAGTALVVDLDPGGPPMPGEGDLASLVARGPTEAELRPDRRGVAVIGNGGIEANEASEVIAALADRWPNMVLRCAPTQMPPVAAVPLIPVLPEPFAIRIDRPSVYQQTHFGGDPQPGVAVLPAPKSATIRSLLSGRMPTRRDKWIGALEHVWELA
jgi:hypothetical protein